MTWQPIGTAPKDGTDVLVWDFDAYAIASWCVSRGVWVRADGEDAYPTHWAPLPEPPA